MPFIKILKKEKEIYENQLWREKNLFVQGKLSYLRLFNIYMNLKRSPVNIYYIH